MTTQEHQQNIINQKNYIKRLKEWQDNYNTFCILNQCFIWVVCLLTVIAEFYLWEIKAYTWLAITIIIYLLCMFLIVRTVNIKAKTQDKIKCE